MSQPQIAVSNELLQVLIVGKKPPGKHDHMLDTGLFSGIQHLFCLLGIERHGFFAEDMQAGP